MLYLQCLVGCCCRKVSIQLTDKFIHILSKDNERPKSQKIYVDIPTSSYVNVGTQTRKKAFVCT